MDHNRNIDQANLKRKVWFKTIRAYFFDIYNPNTS